MADLSESRSCQYQQAPASTFAGAAKFRRRKPRGGELASAGWVGMAYRWRRLEVQRPYQGSPPMRGITISPGI